MLDTKAKVFHESILHFMKWPWNCLSWNALKEKFHSVSFSLKKRSWQRCFSVNFVKFLRTPFFWNTSGGCFCILCYKILRILKIDWRSFFSKLWIKAILTILMQLQDFKRIKHRGGIKNCFCFFPFFKK